jgi:hypothetical protein
MSPGGLVKKNQRPAEPFAADKLRASLVRAGARGEIAELIVEQIQAQVDEGTSTNAIHRLAHRMLKRHSKRAAVTYSLKRALQQLGPSGFPFEQFCGRLFEAMGYEVEYDVIMPGRCVSHEVDVVARNEQRTIFAECKFHNHPSYRNDVKLPLYIHSRSLDLAETPPGQHEEFWILSNTVFSEDALTYADCVGLILAGHNTDHYPLTRELINRHKLHPLTCLSRLTQAQKHRLIQDNVILCREIVAEPPVLAPLGLAKHEEKAVLRECRHILECVEAREENP